MKAWLYALRAGVWLAAPLVGCAAMLLGNDEASALAYMAAYLASGVPRWEDR